MKTSTALQAADICSCRHSWSSCRRRPSGEELLLRLTRSASAGIHLHWTFCCRLEASKDDYRIRCEELEKELLDVKSQNEELTALADEAQSLKDEMDVLR